MSYKFSCFDLQTLYESSTALGFKKSISIEQGKHEMVQKMRELEQGKFKLDDEVKGLFRKCIK